MTYKRKEQFIREYGIRKYFFANHFKEAEIAGKSKNEIQADAIKEEIVKSPLVLNRTYKFYENVKDEIGWIK